MTYTGEVTPGGAPQTRELTHLTITKLAVDPKMSNNAYLLTCRATGESVLIDAADEPQALLELCDSTLEGVITTHQHWDHHRALAEVVDATGATTYAGEPDADAVTEQTGVAVDALLKHGDRIPVGDCVLETIALAGHTPGSVALLYTDPDGHPHLFTGDSLFPGGRRQHVRRRRRVPAADRRGRGEALRPAARRDRVLPRPRQRRRARRRAAAPGRVARARLVNDADALVATYLTGVTDGDVAALVGLFAGDAVVHSPLYGPLPPAEFYPQAVRRHRCRRPDPEVRAAGHRHGRDPTVAFWFHFDWRLPSGAAAPFDVVDVARLDDDGLITELHLVYDTVDVRPAFEAETGSSSACAGRLVTRCRAVQDASRDCRRCGSRSATADGVACGRVGDGPRGQVCDAARRPGAFG